MFCKSCGKEVSDDTLICPQCGDKIAEEPGKKKYTAVIAGVCCAVVVAGIFVAGLAVGKNDRRGSMKIADKTVSTSSEVEKETEKTESTTKKETTTKPATTRPELDSKGIVNPDSDVNGGVYYVQTGDSLHLRKGPAQKYDSQKLMKKGTALVKKGTKNGVSDWVYVQLEAGPSTYGWVNTRYIYSRKPDTSLTGGYDQCNSFRAVVNDEEGLNIRSLPDEDDGSIKDTVSYNREITVLGYAHYDASWFYIKAELSGKTVYGFVLSDYLDF